MLYIHTPFCKTRCIYCDFYSTTRATAPVIARYVRAARAEMQSRATELGGRPLGSIYIGGGTPSLLPPEAVAELIGEARGTFTIRPDAEITLEANPDDITPAYARAIREAGINRMSLGVQSLHDTTLRFLRRRHTADEARQAVLCLREAGFRNISIDLIFGLPGQSGADWQADLTAAFALPIAHLSAYALSIEPGTPMARLVSEHRAQAADEGTYADDYALLLDAAAAHGFEHYEISNFALPGHASRHNSGYWDGRPYVGIGPGACSFDGHSTRRTNRPDLAAYLAAPPGHAPHDTEHLTPDERFNEAVFTALRTRRGLDTLALCHHFPAAWTDALLAAAARQMAAGTLTESPDHRLRLTRRGLFVSDDVMSDLMRV